MNWKVKVLSVEQTKTAKGTAMFKVKVDLDNVAKHFNVFDAAQANQLLGAKERDEEVELLMEQAGEWLNLDRIMSVHTSGTNPIPEASIKPKTGFSGAKASPEKIKSIEKQSALKQAVEYHAGSEVELKEVLKTADEMLKWMSK